MPWSTDQGIFLFPRAPSLLGMKEEIVGADDRIRPWAIPESPLPPHRALKKRRPPPGSLLIFQNQTSTVLSISARSSSVTPLKLSVSR